MRSVLDSIDEWLAFGNDLSWSFDEYADRFPSLRSKLVRDMCRQ